ncbi:MAG: thioredoxin family protein [Pseudomonadota bacterium]
MKRSIRQFSAVVALALLTSFGVASHAAAAPALASQGQAPEFTGLTTWINSPPLTLAGLRGKVVLVDFWTYACYNCANTLPYVTKWHEKYKDKGLVVIGIHTPEFAYEHVTANVRAAVKRFDIKYPVAQDNKYGTWLAYNNRYWPAFYLIDKNGAVVHTHFGEGAYDEMEGAIQTLLAAAPKG